MKKAISVALIMAMCLCLLAACGGAASAPELTVTSDILGLADTGNKTTLKVDLIYTDGPGDINIYHYDESGNRVVYENQEELCIPLDPVTYTGAAVLDLGDGVKDELIDSSNATVRIIDGDGYFADEYILSATTLDGEWVDGKYTYTLDVGDIEWNTWGYDTSADYNSNREWSIMGGDGNGVYAMTFEVGGILYDGKEVPAATFPVHVYCYGRTCTDMALHKEFVPNTCDTSYRCGGKAGEEAKWVWVTDGEKAVAAGKPFMHDYSTDYFSVIWPKGTDASGITAEDVKITLRSEFGSERVLETMTAYGEEEYAVFGDAGETVIAVTYQQWHYVPAYSSMTIEVEKGDVSASTTYDIASVYAFMVQTGGGGVDVDRTLTCYNYYGIGGLSEESALAPMYTLSTEIDGKKLYYAENTSGGYLTENKDEAWQGDGTEKFNIALHGNCIFVESRLDMTEEKLVDGKSIVFDQNMGLGYKSIPDMLSSGAYLLPGYSESVMGGAKWGWTMRYQAGWSYGTAQPNSLPYPEGCYPYGYEPGSSNPVYDEEFAAKEK